MPKMDTGIRTQQGADLFSRVNHGQTGIHFTKAVFSSVDLTGKSDDDIRQMTDIEPQELVVDQSSTRLQTLDEPITDQQQNPETVVRAIAVNDPLTADSSGFYVRTFGLYATDDQGNTVLYGVSLDSHPAYMPQFQGQEQRLAFDWDEDTSDKANIEFTNVHTAYVTWWDFQQFSQAIKSGVDSTEATLSNDNATLASSVNGDMASANSHLASYGGDLNTVRNDLQGKIDANRNDILKHTFNTFHSEPDGSINDLNTLLDSGVYTVYTWNRSVKNCPFTDGDNVIVFVIANYETTLQYAVDDWNGDTYFRGMYSDTTHRDNWKPWTHIKVSYDDIKKLQDQVNDKATKADENWTRDTLVPSAASSAGSSAVNVANSNMTVNRDSLNKRIAEMPRWDDENWTRGQAYNLAESAKSAAQSTAATGDYNVSLNATNYTNDKAQSALNQANTNMEANRSNLQDQVTSNRNDILNSTLNGITSNSAMNVNDLNSLTSTGIYSVFTWGKTVRNCPFTDGDNVIVVVITNYETSLQYAIDDWNGDTYFRGTYAVRQRDNWTKWQHIKINTDDIQNLQNQINQNKSDISSLPNWDDENWTRNVVAPSAANSAKDVATYQANQDATNAMNQANAYTNNKVGSVENDLSDSKMMKPSMNNIGAGTINDFNDLQESGIHTVFTWGRNVKNLPFTDGDNIIVIVIANWETTIQYAIDDWNGAIKYRGMYTDSTHRNNWKDWKTIGVSSDDINNLQNQVNNKVQAAANETDAQNKSGQNPGTLFVYSD